MQIPPEIVYKGVKPTPYVEKLVDRGISGLEQVCDYIISTRILLEQAQGRHQTGNAYQMRIDIRVSGRPEIVVKRTSKAAKKVADGQAEVDAEVAQKGDLDVEETPPARRGVIRRGIREEPIVSLVRRTFDSAQRELKKVVDKQRGEIKTPAHQQASGVVERIFRDQGYGFLRTAEGEQVYFHSNSVIHGHWDALTAGTAVRYVPEVGEKGLQASTVDVIQRVGAADGRDVLRELPDVSAKPRTSKPKKRKTV